MTSYLAPESPRPFSVAAELYFQQLNSATGFSTRQFDRTHPISQCRFGIEYEKEFSFYLAKHAEVNCSDRLCLIGDEPSWANIVQERLFLIKPILFLDSKLHQDVMKEKLSSHTFDRIILLVCLHHLSNPILIDDPNGSETSHISSNSQLISLIHILRKSLTNQGKLLIIHREPNISTLPLPLEVIKNWYDADAHSARLIEQLHRERRKNLELLWEVETIKFTLDKLMWFNLLIHRSFYPLPLTNQQQIIDGLRQLNETYFKYHQGPLEMFDRLLFLSVQNQNEPVVASTSLPKLTQSSRTLLSSTSHFNRSSTTGAFNQKSPPPQKGAHECCDYKMLVTDEVDKLMRLTERRQEKKKNLFQSSLDFM